jgi:AcrR family transcriptional regulator
VRREELILRAAEKLFHERSFDGVGVDAIGKEAGVVGSGIYRHFASKEEILLALMDRATDELLVRIAEPKDDPREELANLVAAHVEFALSHEKLADIWQREQHILNKVHQRSFARRQHRYVERWATCLDACYPGHSREELLATIRALHALMTSDTTRRAGSRPPADLSKLLVALAMGAVEGLAAAYEAKEAAS